MAFELYEPVNHLNALLWRAGIAAAGVPSVILIALMLAMARLVQLAQRNINSRAALVVELRARLERLLSGAASQARPRAATLIAELQHQNVDAAPADIDDPLVWIEADRLRQGHF